MYFINICHYRVNRKDCLRWIYVYYEHRLSFPTVYQSYCIVRIYCSTVRGFFPIVYLFDFFFEKSITFWILYYNSSFLWCGIRLFKLCPLLSLRMTCSCSSFHVVYLLNLPFRSLFIPTSPWGRQRQYSFYNIYNKLPSSFCRFLLCSVFSDLVSGVDILSNS